MPRVIIIACLVICCSAHAQDDVMPFGQISDADVDRLAEFAMKSGFEPDLHTYDVKWEVTGWDTTQRQVVLDKEMKQKTPDKITLEKIVARIGTEPLKLAPTE
jgi:hypothetical protein